MKNKRTSPTRNLSPLSPETAPSKRPSSSLTPHERANLHRRLEVLSFELKRLEAGLSDITDYGCSYLAMAGKDILVYPLPACFIEVANHLRSESLNALSRGDDLTARMAIQLVEVLLNTVLTPENATLLAEAAGGTIGLVFDSVEVPIKRMTDLGDL